MATAVYIIFSAEVLFSSESHCCHTRFSNKTDILPRQTFSSHTVTWTLWTHTHTPMFTQGDLLPPQSYPSLSTPCTIFCVHALCVYVHTKPRAHTRLSCSRHSVPARGSNIPPIGNTCGSLTKADMFPVPCMSAVSQSVSVPSVLMDSSAGLRQCSRLYNVCRRGTTCCGSTWRSLGLFQWHY